MSKKITIAFVNILIIVQVFAVNSGTFSQVKNSNTDFQNSLENTIFPLHNSLFDRKASSFTLQDQFGKSTAIKFPSDKVCVLVFGDREGSEQIEGWVRPLYGKFTDKIYIFGIAELSAVPWVAKPVVRGIIKSKSKNPIMLDWSGKISKSYGYQKGKANLFVVNKEGNIIAEKRGAATSAALADLYGEINSAL